ncbi:unnamed protein product [Mytilus coruscus]|uniref:Uncharacterized protein n=1 Tax=Mytilus coruscus TaxID=42192 RepID=A0A6J8E069_MYTCO|nr:unnamed protein product [Mytilus coruscus]
MATSISLQNEQTLIANETIAKDYSLNKQRSLKKKLDATQNEHFRYNLTGGGLRIWLNAGCYESFRWALNTFCDNKRKENEGNIIYKKVFDKSETVNVEDQYKIKCEGFDTRGRNIKLSCFSINMYHTTSSLLVNGKKLLVFINDHLPEVLNCMKNYQINGKPVDLNMLNKCIYVLKTLCLKLRFLKTKIQEKIVINQKMVFALIALAQNLKVIETNIIKKTVLI